MTEQYDLTGSVKRLEDELVGVTDQGERSRKVNDFTSSLLQDYRRQNRRKKYADLAYYSFFIGSIGLIVGVCYSISSVSLEARAVKEPLRKTAYKKADTNRNGVLEPNELFSLNRALGLVGEDEVETVSKLESNLERATLENLQNYVNKKD